MVDEEEPRLFVNRWGDSASPDPQGSRPHQVSCSCFDQYRSHPRARVGFHTELQDTSSAGWQHLLTLIDEAATNR
ncbi:hypothetical protein [Streptomyces sp. SID14478]|uniref:hypothetical protein n=1 Tax=Streptomyces sp. SID14478 TaxID=2706073 RepID=UPI001EF37191|nr:hypothetical protein [Streptomyces sp. SID14478]